MPDPVPPVPAPDPSPAADRRAIAGVAFVLAVEFMSGCGSNAESSFDGLPDAASGTASDAGSMDASSKPVFVSVVGSSSAPPSDASGNYDANCPRISCAAEGGFFYCGRIGDNCGECSSAETVP